MTAGTHMGKDARLLATVSASTGMVSSLLGLLGFFGAIERRKAFVVPYFRLLRGVLAVQTLCTVCAAFFLIRIRLQSQEDCMGMWAPISLIRYCRALEQWKQEGSFQLLSPALVPNLVTACE
mgnify:FL=1